MNPLEQKIKSNQELVAQKFIARGKKHPGSNDSTKVGFSDGWNNGWSNHGGPAFVEPDFISNKNI